MGLFLKLFCNLLFIDLVAQVLSFSVVWFQSIMLSAWQSFLQFASDWSCHGVLSSLQFDFIRFCNWMLSLYAAYFQSDLLCLGLVPCSSFSISLVIDLVSFLQFAFNRYRQFLCKGCCFISGFKIAWLQIVCRYSADISWVCFCCCWCCCWCMLLLLLHAAAAACCCCCKACCCYCCIVWYCCCYKACCDCCKIAAAAAAAAACCCCCCFCWCCCKACCCYTAAKPVWCCCCKACCCCCCKACFCCCCKACYFFCRIL